MELRSRRRPLSPKPSLSGQLTQERKDRRLGLGLVQHGRMADTGDLDDVHLRGALLHLCRDLGAEQVGGLAAHQQGRAALGQPEPRAAAGSMPEKSVRRGTGGGARKAAFPEGFSLRVAFAKEVIFVGANAGYDIKLGLIRSDYCGVLIF